MSEKILVPALGESITEATIVKWLKAKGETVETDEPIVELDFPCKGQCRVSISHTDDHAIASAIFISE